MCYWQPSVWFPSTLTIIMHIDLLQTWKTEISPSKSSRDGLWAWSSCVEALEGRRKSQSVTPVTACRFGSGADRLMVELHVCDVHVYVYVSCACMCMCMS